MSMEWMPVALVQELPEGGTLQAFCKDEIVCL
jgi:hypothetical protein